MEETEKQICQGCLCSDRKIIVLEDVLKKQCFLQIILEIPASLEDQRVLLCWECEALICRIVRFKRQAQNSYKKLQNHFEKSIKNHKTTLAKKKLYNLSILPDTEGEILHNYELVKLESQEVYTDVKSEVEDNIYSDNHSEDDEKTLIEFCAKEKPRVKVGKKKRKKKLKLEKEEVGVDIETYKEVELSGEEITEERRQMELREDYVNAMFRCERCLVSFPNIDDLKDHGHFKHDLNASNYKCKICECAFASEVSYNYHTNKHTKRYECRVCGERFPSKRGAGKHYENVHCSRVENGLEIEDKYYNNSHKVDPEDENSSKPQLPSFPCEYCDKAFRWKASLRKHLETHRIEAGQKRRPYCQVCRLSFSTTCNLQKHVKTSSKHQIQLKLRKLKDAGPDSTPEKQLARLEQIRSSVNDVRQTFQCGQCDKRFQWRGNLLRHVHSHVARANGELVCAPCNRSFSSIATYQQHMKISRKHVSETDFKHMCSDCGKRFANKTRLRDHVNWEHLKNFTHKCSVCQKVFKSHTSLYLHKQVVHKKNDTEHLCDHCGKPFPNRAKLRCHIIALHTLDAPYACATCQARFSWHSCLSRHVRRVHRATEKAPNAAANV